MIETHLAGQVFYRIISPRWAWAPTSGDGAAREGGRLNRKGTAALYLAAETATAIAEYQQAAALVPPGTLVSYEITLDRVVDFSRGYTSEWDPLWEDMFCDWRKLAFEAKVEPPTWVIADMCQELGFKGILFPSMARLGEGVNLVVFNSMLEGNDKLVVYDPRADLPRTPSWPSP